MFLSAVSTAFSADQPRVPVLYPRDNTIVGRRVNVVLDPAAVSAFQVNVDGHKYPVVDTSATGAHALQGLELKPGVNSIIISLLTPSLVAKDKARYLTVASREVKVFNGEGNFSGVPDGFTRDPFHTREQEAACSDCHRLEVSSQDVDHKKPDEVLCFTCHRNIPTGKNIHGPAAIWDCLACHDPDLYPAKYAFYSLDPWSVSRSLQAVKPALLTLPTATVFRPATAAFISSNRAKEAFGEVLDSIKQNPGYKVRIEVHSDNVPLKPKKTKKGKNYGFRTNAALTWARARTLLAFLKASGVASKRIIAVGMGDRLPKAPNKTQEGREHNNRIEVVLYPPDVKVINSRKLPVLKDRDQVIVGLAYSQGPSVKNLRVVERLPKGLKYIKGSGFIAGRTVEPKISRNELVWSLGNREGSFAESLIYTVKKSAGASPIPESVNIVYDYRGRDLAREFDPKAPPEHSHTVKEACLQCHAGIDSKKFKHGPVDAGYCTLCHDPHASPYWAWLRKPTWSLCTTCHTEKASGAHVVAGHPTRNKSDPSRPGKRLSCASCHEAHSAVSHQLLAYDVKSRMELCSICHKK